MKGLGKRLSALLGQINCGTLADIGCDHGKVGVFALTSGRAEKLIATDISGKSLAKARALAERLGVEASFRTGDGLSVLADGEADCAVIAGMGGSEIVRILRGNTGKCRLYVLLAHKDCPELRRFLNASGMGARADFIVREGGKFYNIITAAEGEPPYEDYQIFAGKNEPRSPYYAEWLDYIGNKYEAIARSATDAASAERAAETLLAIGKAKEKNL